MSFLYELQEKKKKLKFCQTVVTSSTGNKYVEKKNYAGKIEVEKLPETCPGFVVDKKLDLQIAEISEFLYLSSQDVAQDLALLKQNGITHVLSVGIDLPNSNFSTEIVFKKVELLDEPTANLTKTFDECFEFIEGCRKENKANKVLVHCNAGYSRAPTIIIGFLMKKHGHSLKESLKIVSQKREVQPNKGFMEQLRNLEITLNF